MRAEPTDEQIRAAVALVDEGIALGSQAQQMAIFRIYTDVESVEDAEQELCALEAIVGEVIYNGTLTL